MSDEHRPTNWMDTPITFGILIECLGACGGRADGNVNAGDLVAALGEYAIRNEIAR